MSALMPSDLEGFIVQRSDFELFRELCRQRGINYTVLNNNLKNMVIIDMGVGEYLEVESEVLLRRRR